MDNQIASMMDFGILFGSVVNRINQILGMRFTPDRRNYQTHIGRGIQAALDYQRAGNIRHRDVELSRLSMLAQQLLAIRTARPELFKKYKRRLLETRAQDNYFGVRFEVNLAATLCNKALEFKTPDPPDFLVDWLSSKLAIECGSSHVRGSATNLDRRIEKIIVQKSKKPYCAPTTVLCIDISSPYYFGLEVTGETRTSIRELLAEKEFGSVMLFQYVLDQTTKNFYSVYYRIDGPNVAPNLVTFLDKHFPLRPFQIVDFSFPEEG